MIKESKILLEKSAPSALATKPSSITSEKYLFLPTFDIVNKLEGMGWFPSEAKESGAKRNDFVGFQRHTIRFQNRLYDLGSMIPEFLLINGHNARVHIQFYIGYKIYACDNGLVVGSIGGFKEYHLKEYEQMIIDAINETIQKAQFVNDDITKYKTISLTKDEQGAFALEAANLRWNDIQLEKIYKDDLLQIRRPEDEGNSLWHVFNRVQENIIKGGVRFNQRNSTHQYVDRTRPLNQIDRNVMTNIGMWNLLNKYAR